MSREPGRMSPKALILGIVALALALKFLELTLVPLIPYLFALLVLLLIYGVLANRRW